MHETVRVGFGFCQRPQRAPELDSRINAPMVSAFESSVLFFSQVWLHVACTQWRLHQFCTTQYIPANRRTDPSAEQKRVAHESMHEAMAQLHQQVPCVFGRAQPSPRRPPVCCAGGARARAMRARAPEGRAPATRVRAVRAATRVGGQTTPCEGGGTVRVSHGAYVAVSTK